jgi:hypothetical protein
MLYNKVQILSNNWYRINNSSIDCNYNGYYRDKNKKNSKIIYKNKDNINIDTIKINILHV